MSKKKVDILISIILIFLAEVIIVFIATFSFIIVAFMEQGNRFNSFVEFIPTLIFLIPLTAITIAAYFALKVFKVKKGALNYFYVPLNVFIVLLTVFNCMDNLITHELNSKINPLTIAGNIYDKKEIEKKLNTQRTNYKDYLENKSKYQELFKAENELGKYIIALDNSNETLNIIHEGKDIEGIVTLKNIDGELYLKNIESQYLINIQKSQNIYLLEDQSHQQLFFYIKDKNLLYPFSDNIGDVKTENHMDSLTIETSLVISLTEKRDILEEVKSEMLNNIESYTISMEDGVIKIENEISNKLGWDFIKGDKRILARVCKENELAIRELRADLIEPGETYKVYLTTYIQGEYRRVSNIIEFKG